MVNNYIIALIKIGPFVMAFLMSAVNVLAAGNNQLLR